MKKYLLISLALLTGLSFISRGQDIIPNNSFETWDGDPVGWINPLSMLGIQNVIQSDDAQDGSLSAKFIILWDANSEQWVPVALNSLPIPVTESHTTLNGYYKGTSMEGDELFVTVFFYGGGLIAGTGNWSTSASVSDWTQFSVPINYVGGVTPTEAYIYFNVVGENDDAHEGTEYYVDNLSWDAASGIRDLQFVSGVTASPNPAIDHIEIQFSLDGPDVMAFDLISPLGNAIPVVGRTAYHAGFNSIRINTSGLPQGLYILRSSGEKYGFVTKFIAGR